MRRIGRPTVSGKRVQQAIELVRRGFSVTDAARASGVSRQTLTRYGVQRSRLFNQAEAFTPRPEYRPYGETMMDVLAATVPTNTPTDIRDEIIQQLAVDILSGDKVFRLLRERAIEIRRRVNREYHNHFQVSSLNQPVGEGHCTLEDLIEG